MQLTANKKKCTGCNQEISWDAKVREALGIRGPLNLDGTPHTCEAFAKKRQQETVTITDTVATTNPMVTHEEEAKITANLRTEAWNKAHEENMEASVNHTKALKEVAAALLEVAEQLRQKNYIDSHGESST